MSTHWLRQLSESKLKRGGVTGIVIGVSVLLLCEIPLVLALVGLGGLATGALAFSPTLGIQIAATAVASTGAVALLIHRRRASAA